MRYIRDFRETLVLFWVYFSGSLIQKQSGNYELIERSFYALDVMKTAVSDHTEQIGPRRNGEDSQQCGGRYKVCRVFSVHSHAFCQYKAVYSVGH